MERLLVVLLQEELDPLLDDETNRVLAMLEGDRRTHLLS
jgi:hypothetical protein